ncbi:hypothetical protein KP77_25570 [Jeotgalibacillus alimentarius]|uniref:Uncharacterized protein n=1 Tax=Jeotgalibacillus alimentarius TaxID=135826 RepID=A0A0C2R887_9BACL|nr:hypothetical protein [Jeotgalibacillus alimentarius]KIL46430.1 hypothetical protein KP77_25570 [Jeotgalibacillus alimentarius]
MEKIKGLINPKSFWYTLIFTISISSATLLILINFSEINLIDKIFDISTSISSALIGGLIALTVSYSQIKSTREIEDQKRKTIERATIIASISELETLEHTLNTFCKVGFPENTKAFIGVDSLNEFKMNFLYVLNENELNEFLDIWSKLFLLQVDKVNLNEDSLKQKVQELLPKIELMIIILKKKNTEI